MSLQNRLILIFTMTYSNYIIKASLSLSGYNMRPKHTWLFEWGRIIRISCSCSFLKVRWSFYISTTYVILFWITHPWVRYPKENMKFNKPDFLNVNVCIYPTPHTQQVWNWIPIWTWHLHWFFPDQMIGPHFSSLKFFEQWHR